MFNDQLKLNCWVLGDEPSRIFPVNIVKTECVYTLQKVIIDANPDLGDIPARYLDIRMVSVAMDGDLGAKLKDLRTQHDGLPLWRPVDELSHVFPDKPDAQHLHIVVKPADRGKLRDSWGAGILSMASLDSGS
jgi:hypothetical protein